MVFASKPLRLRLLYRFAGSVEPPREICMSSTLLARWWPGLTGRGRSDTFNGGTLLCRAAPEKADAPIDGDCWVGVGVDEEAVPLLLESVLPAPRRYLPGEGFTGASDREKERSGTEVESVIEAGKLSTADFLRSLSSLEGNAGATSERLDEPEVDTVESDEDEGCEGWPSRGGLAGGPKCWGVCWFGADEDLLSCRSCGVLEKAYGAIGADVPLYPAPPD